MTCHERLLSIYQRLLAHFGPQHWWPADTPFEVIVGTILTQNTNWKNVEKALGNLREAGLLNIRGIMELDPVDLESLIRPAGYFRQKTRYLKSFIGTLSEHFDTSLVNLFILPDNDLREQLLAITGIGQETADSIMLYAAGRPSFVVDAYTHRLFVRLGDLGTGSNYEATRRMFMENLPGNTGLFNEYHALIVVQAKHICLKNNPLCHQCPLKDLCKFTGNW